MLFLEKSVNTLTVVVERVLAVALLIGISLNFVNVVGRYVSGYTLTGADEIEIYILIWIAFLGAAVVTWRGDHLRMDVLVNMCPAPVRKVVAIFEMLVLFAVATFTAFQSFKYVERIHALGAVSDIAHIPTWIPHSAITIGFGAIALMVLLRGVQKIAGFDADAQSRNSSEARS